MLDGNNKSQTPKEPQARAGPTPVSELTTASASSHSSRTAEEHKRGAVTSLNLFSRRDHSAVLTLKQLKGRSDGVVEWSTALSTQHPAPGASEWMLTIVSSAANASKVTCADVNYGPWLSFI